MSCDEIKYPISESAVVSLYKYPNFRKRGSAFIRSAGTLYPRFFAAVGAPVFVLSPPPGTLVGPKTVVSCSMNFVIAKFYTINRKRSIKMIQRR